MNQPLFTNAEVARFWPKVEKIESGCWEWRATKIKRGYGWFRRDTSVYGRTSIRAHQFSYLIHKGSREGLFVLHKCDNPSCVRPDHLFLGTQADNGADMARKGRACRVGNNRTLGDDRSSSTLTSGMVQAIRAEYRKGVLTQQKIAETYGVTIACISSLLRGQTWGHLAGALTAEELTSIMRKIRRANTGRRTRRYKGPQ